MMDFEWNPKKAEINREKHGVDFAEACTVFGDTLSFTYPDIDHPDLEERYLIIGTSSSHRILVISHIYHEDNIRIISARQATKQE